MPPNPTEPAFASTSLIGTKWAAKHAADGTGRSLEFASANQVAGHGGCNRFNAQATLAGGSIRIGPIAATKMLCPAQGDAESRFFRLLESVRSGRFEGAELVLLSESGEVALRFTRS